MFGGAILKQLIAISALFLVTSNGLKAQETRFTVDQLTGKTPLDLVGNDYRSTMHRETAIAFETMKKAALADGIELKVVSAFRSFERQKEIYGRKYLKYTAEGLSPEQAVTKIIEYSTIPGTSRHHWGTELDLIDGLPKAPNSVLEAEHFYGQGVFCPMREWMERHAHEYGFIEVYTNHPDRTGFNHEPWHYSYASIAIPYLRAYNLLELTSVLKNLALPGGAVLTKSFLNRYKAGHMQDINPKLL